MKGSLRPLDPTGVFDFAERVLTDKCFLSLFLFFGLGCNGTSHVRMAQTHYTQHGGLFYRAFDQFVWQANKGRTYDKDISVRLQRRSWFTTDRRKVAEGPINNPCFPLTALLPFFPACCCDVALAWPADDRQEKLLSSVLLNLLRVRDEAQSERIRGAFEEPVLGLFAMLKAAHDTVREVGSVGRVRVIGLCVCARSCSFSRIEREVCSLTLTLSS